MSQLATPDTPCWPWLSPRRTHPGTGAPLAHAWWYLWYPGDPWPACVGGRCLRPGLWVVTYDAWVQRYHVRALRAVAGTPAARPPYLCHRHAHEARRGQAARRIPARRRQPLPQAAHGWESAAARETRLAAATTADAAREAALWAWEATVRQVAHAVAAADAAAPDWHRPYWFRPLRLPKLPSSKAEEEIACAHAYLSV